MDGLASLSAHPRGLNTMEGPTHKNPGVVCGQTVETGSVGGLITPFTGKDELAAPPVVIPLMYGEDIHALNTLSSTAIAAIEAYRANITTYIESELSEAVTAVGRPMGVAKTAPTYRWDKGEEGRITLFPIRNPAIWEYRKKLEGLHWVVEEVDMTQDEDDWNTRMTAEEKHFVKYIIGLFSVFDNLVISNLKSNFAKRFRCMEVEAVLSAQEDQEWVHVEAYMLQAQALFKGRELEEVLAASKTLPAVAAAVAWASKYLDPAIGDGEALVAWAFVEGVIFSGLFAGLQWLRERNLLPGTTLFNTFIARDEGRHCMFSCHLARHELDARHRAPVTTAHAIAREAAEVTRRFAREALPAPLREMNAELLQAYNLFQANDALALMDYPAAFPTAANPFPFMVKLSLNEVAKTNFFEKRSGAYGGPVAKAVEFGLNTSAIKWD